MNNQSLEVRNLNEVKRLVESPSVMKRIKNLFGESEVFLQGVVSTVAGSKQLQKCTPDSIMQSAFQSAVLKLPVDKQLGYAYLVPYGKNATFQLGYKGYLQLAIRSGEYKTINAIEIYADEFEAFNALTGKVDLRDSVDTTGDRYCGGEIVGYYAYFTLKNGFSASVYKTREQVLDHAKKYSKAYQYSLNNNKRDSIWELNEIAMGTKTVLKMLLNSFGILSVDIVRGMQSEESQENEQITTEPSQEVQQAVVVDAPNYDTNCPI